MLRWLLLFLLPFSLFALEISFQSGKENHEKYTLLHVRTNSPFICEPQTDEFNNIKKVICAFSKRPDHLLKPLDNDFFNVVTEIKKGTFFVIVTPRHQMKLYPDVFNLSQENSFYESKVHLAKSWLMVGYKTTLPLLSQKKKSQKSLNLPISFVKHEPLSVGSLDIDGNPVHLKQARDINGYVKAKKSFDREDYRGTLQAIDETIRLFPNSMFMSELLLYKIKALSKLEKYEELQALSKIYLRQYSSDDNVAQVLALTAMAYGKLGQNSDADYFYDRLFSEHSDSLYSKIGMIYKGDQLLASGSFKKGLEYYQKALDETNDVDTAATAAYRIAHYYVGGQSAKKAQGFVNQIIQADPNFFLKDVEDSLAFANDLAAKGMPQEASKISQIILATLKKSSNHYEEVLKNSGIWLAKTTQKAAATKLLDRYLKEFVNGEYFDEVAAAKDGLYFDVNDGNANKNLLAYDKLIKSYKNDAIGQKALYKKAQLLLKMQKYTQVLGLKKPLSALDKKRYPNVASMINQAASALVKLRLKEKKCSEVVSIASEYKVKIPSTFDDQLYGCYMQMQYLPKAKYLAVLNLKSKALQERMKWMHRYVNVSFQTGDYKNSMKMGADLMSLMGKDKKSPYNDVYRTMFDANQRVGDGNKMIAMMAKVVAVFGLNFKDVERYSQMMALGTQMKDDNIIITYGEKVMTLQKQTATYTQSPYVEFTTYQSYMNKANTTKAMEILFSLDKRKLSSEQRARQKYLLGALLQKKGKKAEAKKEFTKAIQAQKNSPWAKLASDAMKI